MSAPFWAVGLGKTLPVFLVLCLEMGERVPAVFKMRSREWWEAVVTHRAPTPGRVCRSTHLLIGVRLASLFNAASYPPPTDQQHHFLFCPQNLSPPVQPAFSCMCRDLCLSLLTHTARGPGAAVTNDSMLGGLRWQKQSPHSSGGRSSVGCHWAEVKASLGWVPPGTREGGPSCLFQLRGLQVSLACGRVPPISASFPRGLLLAWIQIPLCLPLIRTPGVAFRAPG